MNIASKRLMRDYAEIKNSNDINIFASPLENNLFEWHANICPTQGIYSGIILHFILMVLNKLIEARKLLKIFVQFVME